MNPFSPSGHLLECSRVSKKFSGVTALDDVSFAVDVGEVHCLAGENGCGKSTLIKIITGIYPPEEGASFRWRGQEMRAPSPAQARRLGMQVIWQDLALFPQITVAENIAFERQLGSLKWVSYRKIRRIAQQALDKLGVSLDLNAPLGTLPIAQRQLVAVARVLVEQASLIFMDEPTASLSKTESDELLRIMSQLAHSGVAVVFVSHRLTEVLQVAQRVTVLRDGKGVGVFPAEDMTQARLAELMSGVALPSPSRRGRQSDSPVVLQCSHLTRTGAFNNVSFSLHAGEVVGLIGLIGAGRTELAHALFGMTKVDGGSVRIAGKTVQLRSNRQAIRQGVAYLSEDRLSLGLIQAQAVDSNMIATVLEKVCNRLTLISARKRAALVQHYIQALAIKVSDPGQAVATLSGGNQQRVALAKWLATEPKILILDSPTVGVDVKARAGIFQLVDLLAEQGLAILLISDEIQEVFAHADRVLHMAGGKIVAEFATGELNIDQMEKAVYGDPSSCQPA